MVGGKRAGLQQCHLYEVTALVLARLSRIQAFPQKGSMKRFESWEVGDKQQLFASFTPLALSTETWMAGSCAPARELQG